MELFQKVLRIEDSYGEEIEVRMPPVLVIEEIRARFEELVVMSQEPGISDVSFTQAYTKIKKYRRLIDKIFGLVNIDAKRLGMDMMIQLLFPHHEYDENGNPGELNTQGALLEFIFGPLQGNPVNSKVNVDEMRTILDLIGELWATTDDLNEVMTALGMFSYEDLGKILKVKAEMMKPAEQKHKEKQANASKKLMERLRSGEVKIENPKADDVPLSDEEISKFF